MLCHGTADVLSVIKELLGKRIETGINGMLYCLGKKKQYIHYYPQKRGLKECYSLSEPDEEADKMMDALRLHQYEMKSWVVLKKL